jgi:HSP20 family protein
MEEMKGIFDAISQRAFGFFQERGTKGQDWNDWFRAESEVLKPVPIEISESSDTYTVRAEVPGFEAKEICVHVEGSSVYVHGKAKHKKEETRAGQIKYTEVSASELSRRIDLPGSVDTEKASANLENGVLTLALPKAVPSKQIPVKAA